MIHIVSSYFYLIYNWLSDEYEDIWNKKWNEMDWGVKQILTIVWYIGTTDTWQIFGPTIIESMHQGILLKILFLTISVQKFILKLIHNDIYYGVVT